jgi:hypothetical protein
MPISQNLPSSKMSTPIESKTSLTSEGEVKEVDLESGTTANKDIATNEKVPGYPTKLEDGTTSIEVEPLSLEVYWDEPVDQDPSNPMNWPSLQKWANIAVLSSITFLTYVSFTPLVSNSNTTRT